MPDGIDMTIENLKMQLSEIKQRLSSCRKHGLDTSIAELKAMPIPSKISMLEVTRDYKDMQKVSRLLGDAKNEIDAIEKESLDESSEDALKEIMLLMQKAENSMKENNIKEAKANYLKCMEAYRKLSAADKKDIFNKLDNLRKSIRG